MKDALIFYISCTQGVALGWYILPLQGADDGLHSFETSKEETDYNVSFLKECVDKEQDLASI